MVAEPARRQGEGEGEEAADHRPRASAAEEEHPTSASEAVVAAAL